MPPSKSSGRPTFRILDYDDRELLAVIDGVAQRDPDNVATAADIAERLGVTVNGNPNLTPAKAIAPRLGAMRTVGLLDRRVETRDGEEGPFKANVWFLTDKGRLILGGKVSKSVESALGRLNDGQKVLVIQEVTRAAYGQGDRTIALTARRSIQHELGQRKVAFRTTKARTKTKT